jgi:murein endopeptidase
LQSDVPGFREEFVEPVDRAAFGHASDQVGDKVDLWLTVTFSDKPRDFSIHSRAQP